MTDEAYEGPELSVTKLDAAKRQLEAAVRLYFAESDPVSIHTLMAAAYQILKDLDAKRGGTGMFVKDSLMQYLTKEGVKIFQKKVNEAENFFKHADNDPGETHVFRPMQTEILLMDACNKYRELTGEIVPVLAVYVAWYWLTTGKKFLLPGEAADRIKNWEASEGAALLKGRARFFQEGITAAYRLP